MGRGSRLRSEVGQGLGEYLLILALIALVAFSALLFLGGGMDTILSTIGKHQPQPGPSGSVLVLGIQPVLRAFQTSSLGHRRAHSRVTYLWRVVACSGA
jgi:hypothetical protein